VGTYWWHGHAESMGRSDGVFGAFIVQDPESTLEYDEERCVGVSVVGPLRVGAWLHHDASDLKKALVGHPLHVLPCTGFVLV
jgi:hypothetical protein